MHRQHCSAKHEKKVKVRNGQWQWAGYIKVDVSMKLRYCIEALVLRNQR